MTAPGAKSGPLTQADIQAIWEGTNDQGFVQGMEAAGEGAGWEAYTQMFAVMARVSQAVDVTTQAMYILPSSGQSNLPASGPQQATVQLTFTRAASNQYVNWPIVIAPGTVFVDEQQNDWGDSGSVPVLTGRRYLVTQLLVIPPGDLGPYTVQATAEFPGYGYNNPLPAYVTAAGKQVAAAISVIDQPGTGYSHDRASLFLTPAGAPIAPPAGGSLPQSAVATLVAVNEADQFIPDHVGQYVLMTAGANVGKVGRISGYLAPGTVAPASAVTLAFDQCVELTSVSGTFQPGEQLQFLNTGTRVATGTCLAATPGSAPGRTRLTYVLQTGTVAVGGGAATVTGSTSAASGTVVISVDQLTWTAAGTVPPNPSQSLGAGENWRVLDWVQDLGVSVTHAQKPSGGTSGMLDELGYERGMPGRIGQEADASYRRRVSQLADTVSPNAIRRAITRAFGGSTPAVLDTQMGLTGFFYDRVNDANGDFYDTSCLLLTLVGTAGNVPAGTPIKWLDASGNLVAAGYWGGYIGGSVTQFAFVMRGGPQSLPPRKTTTTFGTESVLIAGISNQLGSVIVPTCYSAWLERVYLDYTNFRGYFLIDVPPGDAGEFGFYWDTKPASVGGVTGYPLNFFDMRGTLLGFYDGYPRTTWQLDAQVYSAAFNAKAGGVGIDLFVK